MCFYLFCSIAETLLGIELNKYAAYPWTTVTMIEFDHTAISVKVDHLQNILCVLHILIFFKSVSCLNPGS